MHITHQERISAQHTRASYFCLQEQQFEHKVIELWRGFVFFILQNFRRSNSSICSYVKQLIMQHIFLFDPMQFSCCKEI
ncbi:hypothetical protein L6452_05744 [Arctium lappa]|uniref:Uncharacterized protein n=1 Tax=Arctium lappa TaxID=4217 RepID=A0ACB9EHG3_ARCLA|nr:hypothetical protein L6452_05744 [Arctium lappa]